MGVSTSKDGNLIQSKIIEPQRIKHSFEVVCGIDFGTDGIGLAYSLPCDENKGEENQLQEIILHKWKKKLATQYLKKKAQILLNTRGKLRAFGERAASIAEGFEDSQSDSNNTEEKEQQTGYKLIDKFKMSLYHDPRWKNINSVIDEKVDIKEVDLSPKIKAKDGTEFDTKLVFVETLKYLKKEAKYFIKKQLKKPNINKDNIQWILTIPAIWNNSAKTKMRNWAIEAGLISGNYINQLRMVLEPECAALHIQWLLKTEQLKEKLNVIHSTNNYNNSTFDEKKPHHIALNPTDDPEEKHCNNIELSSGDRYILVDAGGGTVDIVSHEIINDFGVKEIVPARGGAYGSNVIDQEMMKMLHELFDTKNEQETVINHVNIYSRRYPKSYIELVRNMTWSKCQFSHFNDDKILYHSIEIPMDFVSYMEEYAEVVKQFDGNMETYLENVESLCGRVVKGKQVIKLTTDYMMIHKDVWMNWFDKCINRIEVDYDEIINNEKMKDDQCKYLFAVGGLAESKYFQHRMRELIGQNMLLVIPEASMLSVVQGAARWGIVRDFVLSRKLSKSYGIEVEQPVNEVERFGLSKQYIETHNRSVDGVIRVVGILNVFAKKGDDIELHYVFNEKYSRHSIKQKVICIKIFESEEEKIPNNIEENGLRVMGSFKLEFPQDSKEMEIGVEYSFDDTILIVTAKWKENGIEKQKRVHIEHCDSLKTPI
eukprot:106435_1